MIFVFLFHIITYWVTMHVLNCIFVCLLIHVCSLLLMFENREADGLYSRRSVLFWVKPTLLKDPFRRQRFGPQHGHVSCLPPSTHRASSSTKSAQLTPGTAANNKILVCQKKSDILKFWNREIVIKHGMWGRWARKNWGNLHIWEDKGTWWLAVVELIGIA